MLVNLLASYFDIYKTKTEISAGETPLIRDACAIVLGRILDNFSLASKDKDFKLL